MKKIFLLFFFGLEILTLKAQQYFQLTNFAQNLSFFNPGSVGMESAMDASATYRNQWVGVDGAPETMLFSFSSGSRKTETDSLGNSKLLSKSGWGFNAFRDSWGGISRNQLNIQYAYHLPVGPETFLSLGASLGFGTLNFGENATLEKTNDQAFATASTSLFPDLNLGAMLYGDKYFIGGSLVQAIQSKLDFGSNSEAKNSKLANHFFLTAGYRHKVSDHLTLVPSVLVKNVSAVSASYDINAKAIINQQFALGLAYRNQESIAFLLGYNLLNQFYISYAYDLITTEISKQADNSHEIRLAYRFKKVGSPLLTLW